MNFYPKTGHIKRGEKWQIDPSSEGRTILNSGHLSNCKVSKSDESIEDIMKIFHTNYKNILPNKFDVNVAFKSMAFQFSKSQIVELLYQMDTLVQLVIQNLLFCTNENTRLNTYELLLKIAYRKDQVLNYLNLPSYKIQLSQFKPESETNVQNLIFNGKYSLSLYFQAKPQMSILQSPLLEFSNVFIEIRRKYQARDRLLEILEEFAPLISKQWLPDFLEGAFMQNTARTKFSSIEDNLLLIGLIKYGSKNLEAIQENYLHDKNINEIKNRYKNMICTRAAPNKVKSWRQNHQTLLTAEENNLLRKGIEWFGYSNSKLGLILRYFLPDRSLEFLQNEIKKLADTSRQQQKKTCFPPLRSEEPNNPIVTTIEHKHSQQKQSTSTSAFGFLGNMTLEDSSEQSGSESGNSNEMNFEQMDFTGGEDSEWEECEKIDIENQCQSRTDFSKVELDSERNFVLRSQVIYEHVTIPGDEEIQIEELNTTNILDMDFEDFRKHGKDIFEVANLD